MFKSLRLENFKCYGGPTGDIVLKPLTVIVGPNNAGKSTLIQAILLFKQTLQDPSRRALVTTGMYVDLGGFHDIIFSGRKVTNQVFSIGLTRDEADEVVFGKGEAARAKLADSTDVSFGFDTKRRDITVSALVLRSSDEEIASFRSPEQWRVAGLAAASRRKLTVEFCNFFPQIYPKGLKEGKDVDIRGLGKAREIVQRIEAQAWLWTRLFHNVHHIPPVRARMPWYDRVGQRFPSEPGVTGESLFRVLGNKDHIPKTKQTLLDLVNNWVSVRLQMLARLRMQSLDEGGTVQSLVADEREGQEGINLAAMGEGVAQVLPIIAESVGTSKNSCLLIEQPELHLHPRAQADLADLFIENIDNRKQFIVETHSEHLLLRIRRRIAEKTLDPKKVAILFVEKVKGRSSVRELLLNDSGHFSEWPSGFFDEGYQEAMAISRAGIRCGNGKRAGSTDS